MLLNSLYTCMNVHMVVVTIIINYIKIAKSMFRIKEVSYNFVTTMELEILVT